MLRHYGLYDYKDDSLLTVSFDGALSFPIKKILTDKMGWKLAEFRVAQCDGHSAHVMVKQTDSHFLSLLRSGLYKGNFKICFDLIYSYSN